MSMDADLKSLKINRDRPARKGSGATKWIVIGVVLLLVAAAGAFLYKSANAPREVATTQVPAPAAEGAAMSAAASVLDATGYIVAAHKIALAAKVVGKVAWIGVNKGDRVTEGQVIVRLEDEEYKAGLTTALGQLDSLNARLAEAKSGSRPEEIQRAQADLDQAKADRKNAQINLERTRKLVSEGVSAKQTLDDAVARMDGFDNRVKSLERTLELAKLGPRKEVIAAIEGNIREAKGRVELAQTQLNNTVIQAPIRGTILQRNVEKGEFVTTGFSGVGGAKGFVVSLADLKDIAGNAPQGDAVEIARVSAPLRQQELDKQGRAYATGRRKDAVARVWVKPGTGKITINGRDQETYFARPTLRLVINQPFTITDRSGQYDVVATVRGGGLSGQAGAVKHGIAQALSKYEPELRTTVKAAGFLTRDSRVVERKKYGKAKARRSFQFSKR